MWDSILKSLHVPTVPADTKHCPNVVFNAGPASKTVGQYLNIIGFRVMCLLGYLSLTVIVQNVSSPTTHKNWILWRTCWASHRQGQIQISSHMESCLATAIHNFKWLKITDLSNLDHSASRYLRFEILFHFSNSAICLQVLIKHRKNVLFGIIPPGVNHVDELFRVV